MDESLSDIIQKIAGKKQPKSRKDMVQLLKGQVDAGLDDIKRVVQNLRQNVLILREESKMPANSYTGFLSSRKSLWFWIVIGLTSLAFISIFLIPETGTPLSYLRYGLGFVLAFFLPGYCLTEVLFPGKDQIDEIERFTFSVGLSFAITALAGLFLSFTPIRLTLATALLTLNSVVIVLALVALNRKYRA